MSRPWRRRAVRWLAALCAFGFGVASLALLDLVTGLTPAADESTSHAIADVAFGVLGVLLIAPAYGSLARGRSDAVVPLSQVGLVVVGLVVSAAWSGEVLGLVGAAAVLLPLAVVWAMHPDRPNARRSSWTSTKSVQLACAAALVVVAWAYAGVVAVRGRAGLLPEEDFSFVPSFSAAVVAMLVATGLVALMAAGQVGGWTVSVLSVAAVVSVVGVAFVVNPHAPASGGIWWGVLAIVWVVAWLLAARQSRDRGPA